MEAILIVIVVVVALSIVLLARKKRSLSPNHELRVEVVDVPLPFGTEPQSTSGPIFEWILKQDDQLYYIRTRRSEEETKAWLHEYATRGTRCHSCNALIFPRSLVDRVGKNFVHGAPYPCSIPGGHWGHTDETGKLVPSFDGLTSAELAFKKGVNVLGKIEVPSVDQCEYWLAGIAPIDNPY